MSNDVWAYTHERMTMSRDNPKFLLKGGLAPLKLRQLRLLVGLDCKRQLQAAADSIGITQSAASKTLAEVEAIVGAPLFERSARGVEPTPHGTILIRGSRSVLLHLDQAAEELSSYMAGESGPVFMGSVAAPCIDLIVDVWQHLGHQLENVKVSLEVATSPPLIKGLIDQKFDFITARMPADVDPGQFDFFPIADEDVCFLVRPEHPLAPRKRVSLAETTGLQWICQPPGSFLRISVEKLFYSRGLKMPRRIINTESFFAALVIASRLDAIVPASHLLVEIADKRKFKTLKADAKITLDTYGLIKLSRRRLSPAASVIFEAMKRHVTTKLR
jgi:DNA-binding transcriptional LysR family regulator